MLAVPRILDPSSGRDCPGLHRAAQQKFFASPIGPLGRVTTGCQNYCTVSVRETFSVTDPDVAVTISV